MNKIINPKLEKYYKYSSNLNHCQFNGHCCKTKFICDSPNSCCTIWRDENISQNNIDRISAYYEKFYGGLLFIDFIDEFCKLDVEVNNEG
jgi:hypothetical protein